MATTHISTNKHEIKRVTTALTENNLRGEWADSLMRVLFTAYAGGTQEQVELELTAEEYEQWLKYGGRPIPDPTLLCYDDDGKYIGPESEYNDFGFDSRTGEPWPTEEPQDESLD